MDNATARPCQQRRDNQTDTLPATLDGGDVLRERLRAGVEGLSENIRVRSILGRFLEHSRIFAFQRGEETRVLIGSADLMHRNLDRRVEALVRITDPAMVEDLEWLVTHCASDDVASWHLQPDGSWKRRLLDAEGNRLEDIQDSLMARARSRVKGRH